jgi:hypothetical protein
LLLLVFPRDATPEKPAFLDCSNKETPLSAQSPLQPSLGQFLVARGGLDFPAQLRQDRLAELSFLHPLEVIQPSLIQAKGHLLHRSVSLRFEVDQETLLRDRVKIPFAIPTRIPKPLAADPVREVSTKSLGNLIDRDGGLGAAVLIHAFAKGDGPILPAFVTTWH